MSLPYPEPTGPEADTAVLLERLLPYYRSTVVAKVRALDERDRRTPQVPSGWSPLGLVSHLAHMERRWIVWGFHGRQVDGTWGDFETDGREVWWVPDDVTLDDVEAMMAATAAETTALLPRDPARDPRLDRGPAALGPTDVGRDLLPRAPRVRAPRRAPRRRGRARGWTHRGVTLAGWAP